MKNVLLFVSLGLLAISCSPKSSSSSDKGNDASSSNDEQNPGQPPATTPSTETNQQTSNQSNAPTPDTNAPAPAPDTNAPAIGSEILIAATASINDLTVSWGAATDTESSSLQYKLVRAESISGIDSLSKIQALPATNTLLDWSENLSTNVTINPLERHAFTVVVKDAAGNQSFYTPKLAHRLKVETSGLLASSTVQLVLNGSQNQTISQNGIELQFGWFFANTPVSLTVGATSSTIDCALDTASGDSETTTIEVSCLPRLRMFVSSSGSVGNFSGGISGADSICQNDANKPTNRPATYKAMVSKAGTRVACTSNACVTNGLAENIDWVLKPTRTYVRASDGQLIGTTNSKAIFDTNLQVPFNSTSVLVWFGLTENWTNHTFTCSGWTSSSSTAAGGAAFTNTVNQTAAWGNAGTSTACNGSRKFLCVEQ